MNQELYLTKIGEVVSLSAEQLLNNFFLLEEQENELKKEENKDKSYLFINCGKVFDENENVILLLSLDKIFGRITTNELGLEIIITRPFDYTLIKEVIRERLHYYFLPLTEIPCEDFKNSFKEEVEICNNLLKIYKIEKQMSEK